MRRIISNPRHRTKRAIMAILSIYASPALSALGSADACSYTIGLTGGAPIGLKIYSLSASQRVSLSNNTANAASTLSVSTYVELSGLGSASDHTGSLRFSIWAVPYNHMVGPAVINGYKLGQFTPGFKDANGNVRDYIYNFTSASLYKEMQTTNPPAGMYCAAIALEQFGAKNCTTADQYCLTKWLILTPALQFK